MLDKKWNITDILVAETRAKNKDTFLVNIFSPSNIKWHIFFRQRICLCFVKFTTKPKNETWN